MSKFILCVATSVLQQKVKRGPDREEGNTNTDILHILHYSTKWGMFFILLFCLWIMIIFFTLTLFWKSDLTLFRKHYLIFDFVPEK